MFGGCVKVRESLHARIIIWVSIVLNHIDTIYGEFTHVWKFFSMVYEQLFETNRLWVSKTQNFQVPISLIVSNELWYPCYIYPNGITTNDTSPQLVSA